MIEISIQENIKMPQIDIGKYKNKMMNLIKENNQEEELMCVQVKENEFDQYGIGVLGIHPTKRIISHTIFFESDQADYKFEVEFHPLWIDNNQQIELLTSYYSFDEIKEEHELLLQEYFLLLFHQIDITQIDQNEYQEYVNLIQISLYKLSRQQFKIIVKTFNQMRGVHHDSKLFILRKQISWIRQNQKQMHKWNKHEMIHNLGAFFDSVAYQIRQHIKE